MKTQTFCLLYTILFVCLFLGIMWFKETYISELTFGDTTYGLFMWIIYFTSMPSLDYLQGGHKS